jgi:transcriptional regulator with XRE-family HTH domain
MKTQALGDLLRQTRIARKMKQVDLGKLLGVSQQAIWRWEKGEMPGEENVENLAKFLGVDRSYIDDQRTSAKITSSQIGNTATGGSTIVNSGSDLTSSEAYLIRLVRKHGGDGLIDEIIAHILSKK